MFTRRQTVVFYAAGVVTALFAAFVIYLEVSRGGGDPPVQGETEVEDAGPYWKLPEFQLTNQDGQGVGLDDLKGQVWLADFVYTTCPGQCPLITAHMARLQKKLPAEARIVSFSTDPDTDTPAILKAYGARYGATERWTFLTGPKAKVYDLIHNGFKLAIAAAPGAEIVHSTKMILVDKTGTVRGFYEGTTDDADDKIVADTQKLLGE